MKQNLFRFEIDCAACGESVALVPDSDCGPEVMVPAPAPTAVLTGGWRPWHVHRRESVAETFLWRPSAREGVSTVGVVAADGGVTVAGVVDGIPACALSVDSGSVTFVSAGRRRWMRLADGRWSVGATDSGLMPRLSARAGAAASVSTGAFSFKGVSQSDPELTEAQIADLGHRLLDAYESLAASMASSGQWMQPMLVAVRLVGSDGEEVAVSSPLLMAPERWQCAGLMETTPRFTDDGVMRVDDMRLEARGYVIDVDFPEGISSRAVFAEIVALPQMHVADSSASAPVRLISRSDGLRLTAAVPGATRRFASLDAARAASLLADAPKVAGAGSVIGRFDLSACEGSVQTLRCGAVVASAKKGSAAVSKAAGVGESVVAAVVQGAEFTASAVARGGDCVLWADISLAPLPGDSPAFFAAATSDTSWQAAVEVVFASGEKSVTHYAGDSAMPLSLTPLVGFPSRDAVSLRLIVEDDSAGTRTSVTLPLTADPEGREWAGWISSSLAAVQLVADSAPFPAERTMPRRRYPSMLLLAPASEPLRPVAALTCGTATVRYLEVAVRARSAWDAHRQRFLAFTADGVLGVSASASTAFLGASRIDVTLCCGAVAAATTPVCVVAACGDRLIACGSNSVWPLCHLDRPTAALCWCPALSMLALLDAQGNLSLLSIDGNGALSSRTSLPLPFAPEAIGVGADGSLWIDGADSLWRLAEGRPESAKVGLSSSITVPEGQRPYLLTLYMSGSSIRGTVTLRAGERRVVGMAVDGAFRHPLRLRLAAPPRRRLVLSLDAEVSADFRWEGAEMSTVGVRRPR